MLFSCESLNYGGEPVTPKTDYDPWGYQFITRTSITKQSGHVRIFKCIICVSKIATPSVIVKVAEAVELLAKPNARHVLDGLDLRCC